MPATRPIVRAALVAATAVLTLALAGCATDSTPAASATPSCTGHVKAVLLGDDSATDVVSFDASDSPKIFNLPATPVPNCVYRTATTTSGSSPTTVTHRTYLYIGISSDAAQKLIATLGATAGQSPWTGDYSNVPAPSTTPAPYALQAASWNYNVGGTSGQDRGSMSYAYNAPINPGVAAQAGVSGSPNVLRIETEITTPGK